LADKYQFLMAFDQRAAASADIIPMTEIVGDEEQSRSIKVTQAK